MKSTAGYRAFPVPSTTSDVCVPRHAANRTRSLVHRVGACPTLRLTIRGRNSRACSNGYRFNILYGQSIATSCFFLPYHLVLILVRNDINFNLIHLGVPKRNNYNISMILKEARFLPCKIKYPNNVIKTNIAYLAEQRTSNKPFNLSLCTHE